MVAVLAAGVAAAAVLTAYHPSSTTTAGSSSSGSGLQPPSGSGLQPPSGSQSTGNGVSNAGEQAVVNKIEPGLVFINTNLQYDSEAAAGTGMIINPDGLVLTNNHVIEGATKITATLVSSGKTYPAKVVGYDKTGDVAVIQLSGASGLHTVPLGNASSAQTGTPVVAMGNAEGQGQIVPAAGQIIGTNKTIKASDNGGTATAETLHGMLKTNADIVSGDSGGPLASTKGVVVGMDTAGNDAGATQQASATGFAIPITRALSIAGQIAAGHGSSTVTIGYPPFVGIFVAPGTSSNPQTQQQQQQQQQQSNLPGGGFGGLGGGSGNQGSGQGCSTSNADLSLPTSIAPVSSGALVDGAICGSPAASAGITGGSVITSVNGQPAGAPTNLTKVLSQFHPGDTISVAWVSPSGQHHTSSIHLVAGPPQ
jgi:S1-C subfamily serine protease